MTLLPHMKPYSLTIRLATLFSLLAFCILSGIGVALYQGLASQLRQHEHAELQAKVERLRTLLEKPQGASLLKNDAMLLADIARSDNTFLQIGLDNAPPLVLSSPNRFSLQSADDEERITASTSGMLARTGKKIHITASRTARESLQLLQSCLERILVQIALAALLFGIGGVVIVRLGLLPLRRLATQAEGITVANLNARLNAGNTPREIGPLLTAINTMLSRLSIGFSKLSQVSTDMAHDLRTPINNLLGQTEVALRTRRSADEYEILLGSNLEELQRLAKMIDNMLFLARSENAETEIDRKMLDSATELHCVADYFEGLAEEKALRLTIDASAHIHADPMLLRRALANLVANALKHAQHGSTIMLRTTTSASETILTVENRGLAIDEHHLPRLFDRFYRADSSRLGSAQASGLGLAIVRSIMQLHQGRCTVSSNGGITQFNLHFPVPLPSVRHAANATIRRPPSPPSQYRHVTIPAQTVE